MSVWSALPAWMRRVPVVGWLAAALVVAVLLWLRSRRIAAAERAHADAIAETMRARMRLADEERRAADVHRAETADLRERAAAAEEEARVAYGRVVALEGQSLADEMNRVFRRK